MPKKEKINKSQAVRDHLEAMAEWGDTCLQNAGWFCSD